MKRNSFFLTIQQKDKYAKKVGITTSELLRRIVDRYFEEKENVETKKDTNKR